MLKFLMPVMVAVVGLSMTACADDAATESASGIDWYSQSWMQPAGTPMVAGLVVQTARCWWARCSPT